MKRRKPVPPTHHLKSAIRKIDEVAWKLNDEQIATSIAYVLAVSRGEKRHIRKLFGAQLTPLCDYAVRLEGKLTPKERRHAMRLTAYETEIESLHEAAQRLRSQMEASYLHQRRFEHGSLDESGERQPKVSRKR